MSWVPDGLGAMSREGGPTAPVGMRVGFLEDEEGASKDAEHLECLVLCGNHEACPAQGCPAGPAPVTPSSAPRTFSPGWACSETL